MLVLIVAIGTYGDVLPFIAAGAELVRRGHEVALCAPAPFGDAARRAGLDFAPAMSAEEYERRFGHPTFWTPWRGARRLFRQAARSLPETYGFIAERRRPGETVVVGSTLAIGARVAFDVFGDPLISVHLSPLTIQTRHDAPRTPGLPMPRWLHAGLKWELQLGSDAYFVNPVVLPRLNAFRATLGLGPVQRLRYWWNSPLRVAAMFPAWFHPAQPDWPAQTVQIGFPEAGREGGEARGLDPALEAFLAAGDPPVLVTFGSTRRDTERLYRVAIAACARLGRRCLALSQTPIAGVGEGRADVHVARYAPLPEVLPRCAAIVHHGGVGTMAQAFAAGAPQLVAPLAFDQADHAVRVAKLGCGAAFRTGWFDERRAARLLGALLRSERVRARCAEIAAACDGPGALGRLCDEIEELAPSRAA